MTRHTTSVTQKHCFARLQHAFDRQAFSLDFSSVISSRYVFPRLLILSGYFILGTRDMRANLSPTNALEVSLGMKLTDDQRKTT